MQTGWIVFIVIIAVLTALIIGLYFLSKKAEKTQAAQKEQMDAIAQQVSMLIIDKKRLRLKESGLPQQVIDATPWYGKTQKIPVVKAKVGPQMMTLICDATIFDEIPVKKEVKATVSGLYITKVKGLHGKTTEAPKKKKGLRAWALRKQKELNNQK